MAGVGEGQVERLIGLICAVIGDGDGEALARLTRSEGQGAAGRRIVAAGRGRAVAGGVVYGDRCSRGRVQRHGDGGRAAAFGDAVAVHAEGGGGRLGGEAPLLDHRARVDAFVQLLARGVLHAVGQLHRVGGLGLEHARGHELHLPAVGIIATGPGHGGRAVEHLEVVGVGDGGRVHGLAEGGRDDLAQRDAGGVPGWAEARHHRRRVPHDVVHVDLAVLVVRGQDHDAGGLVGVGPGSRDVADVLVGGVLDEGGAAVARWEIAHGGERVLDVQGLVADFAPFRLAGDEDVQLVVGVDGGVPLVDDQDRPGVVVRGGAVLVEGVAAVRVPGDHPYQRLGGVHRVPLEGREDLARAVGLEVLEADVAVHPIGRGDGLVGPGARDGGVAACGHRLPGEVQGGRVQALVTPHDADLVAAVIPEGDDG